MGLSSSTSTSKNRPYVDPYMDANLKGYAGKVNAFLDTDPTQFVAPESALQKKAFAEAKGLGAWQDLSNKALDMAQAAGVAGPASADAIQSDYRSILDEGGIQKYLDPGMDAYVHSAMADYDADTGRRGAAMRADAAKNHAFGGSRHGIAEGEFEGQAARSRSSIQSELMRRLYEQAVATAMGEADRLQSVDISNAGLKTNVSMGNAGLAEQQMMRALQAAGLIGDISSSIGAGEARDLALAADLGGQQRGIDAEYKNAVPTQLQMGGNLFGAIPPGAYIGSDSKTKTTTPWGPILGSLASAAISKFSDRRLKTDIRRIGTHGSLPIYSFRYVWDDRPSVGVMADEVAIHAPEALGPVIGGYATVDYGQLGLEDFDERR